MPDEPIPYANEQLKKEIAAAGDYLAYVEDRLESDDPPDWNWVYLTLQNAKVALDKAEQTAWDNIPDDCKVATACDEE